MTKNFKNSIKIPSGFGFFLGQVIFMLCSCNTPATNTDIKTELPRIENSIRSCIGWAKNKDFKLLYSVIANDSSYLEVDPGEGIIRGFEQFRKNEELWGDTSFKAIGYEIRDLNIVVSESGTVSWFYCMLDDKNEWMGKPASWINTRWTGVLEKRNGSWKMVQMHFSFAKEI